MKFGITYTPHIGIFQDTRCCWWREIGDPQLYDTMEQAEDKARRVYGGPGKPDYIKFDVRIEGESKVRAVNTGMLEHLKQTRK